MKKMNGFTLIELVIGVVICGILLSLVAPAFPRIMEFLRFATGTL